MTLTRTSAKTYFITNAKPSQAQFAELFEGTVFQQGASAQFIQSNVSALGAWEFKASASGITQPNIDNSTNLATTAFVKNLLAPATNTLSGDVNLSNASLFFDGPSVSAAATGTYLAVGQVVVIDPNTNINYLAKLWDGTTVAASTTITATASGQALPITLTGTVVSPAGNIRISVRDQGSTAGKIVFNQTGLSKDSTISIIRVV